MVSPWLLNYSMDGCMRKIKAKMGNVSATLKINGLGWLMVACLFADNTVICRERKKNHRVVN